MNHNEPYAFLVEKERLTNGEIEDVATIFLTNKECPFRCLMCDLWKNTTDYEVPEGAITRQIEFALEHLPSVKHIKLYNSGNFFDTKAIPLQDFRSIAELLSGFDSVLVENHPNLSDGRVLDFNKLLNGSLQIAMGLETVHPEVLPMLNKRMKLSDFHRAVHFLNHHDISVRTFILLRPPFLNENEGILWAKRSIDFAFDCGVECCVVIPTRSGNGALEALEKQGYFSQPEIRSLEAVLEYGISLKKGRVFADLWDLEHFSRCNQCFDMRVSRIRSMNIDQSIHPQVICGCMKNNGWRFI